MASAQRAETKFRRAIAVVTADAEYIEAVFDGGPVGIICVAGPGVTPQSEGSGVRNISRVG